VDDSFSKESFHRHHFSIHRTRLVTELDVYVHRHQTYVIAMDNNSLMIDGTANDNMVLTVLPVVTTDATTKNLRWLVSFNTLSNHFYYYQVVPTCDSYNKSTSDLISCDDKTMMMMML
jgi:hypothetical protein